MATATEYRQYAQECIQCAREAATDPVRKQFLDLAKLWMTAAERMDAGAQQMKSKADGHAFAGSGVVGPNEPS